MPVKVAVCQVPDIREDIETSLGWIEKFVIQAEIDGVSLVCFPECFLQGNLTEKHLTRKYAINFASSEFKVVLNQFATYKPMIFFVLIEEKDKNLFTTKVVIKKGD